MSRYREVAEIVLTYLEHRDRLVRLSITSLLPRIAHFLRDRFVTNYLTVGFYFSLINLLDHKCHAMQKRIWMKYLVIFAFVHSQSLFISYRYA